MGHRAVMSLRKISRRRVGVNTILVLYNYNKLKSAIGWPCIYLYISLNEPHQQNSIHPVLLTCQQEVSPSLLYKKGQSLKNIVVYILEMITLLASSPNIPECINISQKHETNFYISFVMQEEHIRTVNNFIQNINLYILLTCSNRYHAHVFIGCI
jgi:hypothetical protein